MAQHSKSQQAGILVWGKITAIAAEALLPIMLIWLLGDPADVGVYAVLMLVYKLLTMILTAGFPRAVLYFFGGRPPSEKRELATKLTAVMVILGAAMGLLLAVIGLYGHAAIDAAASFIGELVGRGGLGDTKLLDALNYMPWMAPYAIFDLSSRILPQVLISEERPKAAALIPLLRSSVTLIGTLLPVLLGYNVAGIVIGLNISGFVRFVVYICFMVSLYGKVESTKGKVKVRELFAYALPLGLTNVVNDLNSNMDMWLVIIVYLASAAEVAVYRAGSWQIPIVTTIAYTVGSVYLAKFKSLHQEGKGAEAVQIWRYLVTKVSLIVVPVAATFAVSAEEFIAIVFPDDYSGAANIFRAYCFLTMARVSAYGSALVAASRPKDVIKSSIFTLLSNAVISIPLVIMMGFVGPAVGTALAIIPATGVYCLYIARAYDVRLRDTFPVASYLAVLLIAAVPSGIAILFKLNVNWPAPAMLAVQSLIILVGFALLATALGRIKKEDWLFVWEWATLKIVKGKKPA